MLDLRHTTCFPNSSKANVPFSRRRPKCQQEGKEGKGAGGGKLGWDVGAEEGKTETQVSNGEWVGWVEGVRPVRDGLTVDRW